MNLTIFKCVGKCINHHFIFKSINWSKKPLQTKNLLSLRSPLLSALKKPENPHFCGMHLRTNEDMKLLTPEKFAKTEK